MEWKLALVAGVLVRKLWRDVVTRSGQLGEARPRWGGRLLGEFGRKSSLITVDVWEQQGIYVLWHEWQVMYVGKAISTALGSRLRNHLSDRLAGRWDRFSWYGIRTV